MFQAKYLTTQCIYTALCYSDEGIMYIQSKYLYQVLLLIRVETAVLSTDNAKCHIRTGSHCMYILTVECVLED